MNRLTTVSAALAGALLLTACGGGAQTNETDNAALVNFAAPPEENAILANDFSAVDGNVAVESNSLDNAAAGDGNAL